MFAHDSHGNETAFLACSHQFEQNPFDFEVCLHLAQASLNVCDWSRLPHLRQVIGQMVGRGAFMMGETALAGTLDAHQQLASARRYSAWVGQQTLDAMAASGQSLLRPPLLPPVAGQRPLRVGLLGADFHHQATAYLLVGVLEALRDNPQWGVEVMGYDHGPTTDSELRQRMVAALRHLRPVHELSDLQTAQCIANDGIDILLLIKGPGTGRFGVCALRPAPVQMFYLYYPGTSGAEYLDYFITDPVVAPPELAHLYAEKLAYLPRCYQPNDRHRPLPQPMARELCGLPDNAFVLANFNQCYKITPEMFDAWCSILVQAPHAVLWLLESNERARHNLRSTLALRGLDPARLIFGPPLATQAHFSRLACADLLLDTHPYGAHTGTSDALWTGLPVLTLMGESFASRVAASLLHSVGLDALVTTTLPDYVAMAVALAHDPAPLASWRAHLQTQRYQFAVFDSEGYARDFAALLWAHAHPHP